MAGVKRPRDDANSDRQGDSPYVPMFETFRAELDEHHDRRERVVKASRDVTAFSKKIIFSLQRARKLGVSIPQNIAKDIESNKSKIYELFDSVSPDLQGLNAYRYQRNISGGIQEFMEAVLFRRYLETQQIMTKADATDTLAKGLHLTDDDYVLGLFDMTGELMRFAITFLATNGSLPETSGAGKTTILNDMQALRMHLEALDVSGSYGLNRDYEQKLKTTRSSVDKVENGVYSMIVRGKERPKGWRPDTAFTEGSREGEAVESY